MKRNKIGFWKKLFLVTTDFRTYPFLVKHEKFYKAVLYILNLIFILSIVISINEFMILNKAINTINENFDELVPNFVLQDGYLNVDKKVYEKIDNNTFIAINTNFSYDNYKLQDEYLKTTIYNRTIIINNDAIAIQSLGEDIYIIEFEKTSESFTKSDLKNIFINISNEYTIKVAIVISIIISIFISYLITVFFKIIIIGMIISIMCAFRGIRLDYRNYYKIAIYSYTLPLIVEAIVLCIVGPGKEYASYASMLLTYVYIIYAIRAIRLDAFIMMFSRKDDLKHNSSEFENELKKYNEITNNDEVDKENNEENNDNDKKEE